MGLGGPIWDSMAQGPKQRQRKTKCGADQWIAPREAELVWCARTPEIFELFAPTFHDAARDDDALIDEEAVESDDDEALSLTPMEE